MNKEADEQWFAEYVNPPVCYRGLPFWAWNTELKADQIRKQVAVFARMGFGGFVIHSRNGLNTEYLGETFMEMVQLAIKCAKKYGMKVWLYDEDRWPSGCAGGLVTSVRKYRQKSVLFTKQKRNCVSEEIGRRDGLPYLLASFRVEVDADGFLTGYKITDADDANLYAYVMTADDTPRFNRQAYVDTLNPDAIAKFIETTYEKYYAVLGEDFGDTVEAIFTDEPQVIRLETLRFSPFEMFSDTGIPWTDNFPETYRKVYGEDPVSKLPEILWEMRNEKYSVFRYRYNEHIAERFRTVYSRQVGEWCTAHGIHFTGHFLNEDSLKLQTINIRDVMRCYATESIPGVDVLKGKFELATVLQCRSVAHQNGKKRVMSELYGVSNWDADFRDYIHQGNWQTALGVNVRIPHLSWMSMRGEGKRDYPATFGYQVPWHCDFHLVEDYFARLNVILSRGEPCVKLGVIHPIESYWLLNGAKDKTERLRNARDRAFGSFCKWLLFGGIDFDFLNESLLPSQFEIREGTAYVGKMQYEAVIVPDCLTLRSSTVDILEQMRTHGVQVIFAGNIPSLVDAYENNRVKHLAADCRKTEFTCESILRAVSDYRSFELLKEDGGCQWKYIYCERRVGQERWFFLTPAQRIEKKEDTQCEEYFFKIKGCYHPLLFDAYAGRTKTARFFYAGGYTWIKLRFHSYDTALLRLCPEECPDHCGYVLQEKTESVPYEEIPVEETVGYRRKEDNVLLLDMAEYSYDGETYFKTNEIFKIDTICRKYYGLPSITGKNAVQPWCIKDDYEHDVWLRYEFESETEAECLLGAERVEYILFNGKETALFRTGYYVDEDIHTFRLAKLRKGKNCLTVRVKIGKIFGLEPMYLLGDFDVRLTGTVARLTMPSDRIGFGSIVPQGMPFYGGNLIYRMTVNTPDCDLTVSANDYRCGFIRVFLDGRERGNIILSPYRVVIPDVGAGEHELELECFGNRHNTFGSLHWGIADGYYGPAHWHKEGDAFSREYKLRDFGILKSPRLICERKPASLNL